MRPRVMLAGLLHTYYLCMPCPADYCLRFDYTSLERDGKKEVDEDF